MKETLKKISDVFKLIFGYGIMIVLFAGGLTFFGYVAALIIGGPTAESICTWIYKSFILFSRSARASRQTAVWSREGSCSSA